jgi:hypothetical protein
MRVLLLAALLLSAPAHAATRSFTVTSFDRVRVAGPFKVDLRIGTSTSARAEGSPAALNRLKVGVQGSTLVIDLDRTYAGLMGAETAPVSLSVSTPSLTGAALTGSGALTIDRVKARLFSLNVSGSGDVAIGSLIADQATVAVAGPGRATIAGKVGSVRASLQGSGAIEAAGLDVADLDLSFTGSGKARLAASRTAKIFAAGSGDVIVTGDPACTVRAQGSGEVRCGGDR